MSLARLYDDTFGITASVAMIVFFAMSALLLAFVGRTRLPPAVMWVLLALCGAGIGFGAGALERVTFSGVLNTTEQGREWLGAILILAVLTPLHARVVFGPLGRKG